MKEETLDPQDWETMRELGHRMVNDMMDYLQHIRERPVWQQPDAAVKEGLQQPLPLLPQDAAAVYEEFTRLVLPYNSSNVHPRFWGWVMGGGTPLGMMADMLASGMNTNVSIGDSAPMYVERQVLDWSKEIFGFPPGASGLLTSGASMANITAMIVARNHFDSNIKKKGIRAVPAQMMVYGSSETHNCVQKGIEAIGIGGDHFRKVPVDDDYRIRLDLLAAMIREDKAAGAVPFCLIGNAGTVNTGAIDDLMGLAAIAASEGIWFHIDGAFGAIPRLLPEFGEILKGLELADSLSFDFHKWLYMNYEVGCLLVKDAAAHREAFTYSVNYLVQHERGLSAGPDPFSNYGLELSRGFKALKVWMLLKEHGVQQYARQVRQNLDQAQYLGQLIMDHPELELLAAVNLNIVCYRYKGRGNRPDDGKGPVPVERTGKGMDDGRDYDPVKGTGNEMDNNADLNTLNKEILVRLHEQGIAAPSYTVLNGRYTIRVAITNHRSRLEDFDALVEASIRIGRELEFLQLAEK